MKGFVPLKSQKNAERCEQWSNVQRPPGDTAELAPWWTETSRVTRSPTQQWMNLSGPWVNKMPVRVSRSKSIREWLWLRNEQIGEHLVTIAHTAQRNLEGSRLLIWATLLSQRLAARGLCAEAEQPICDLCPSEECDCPMTWCRVCSEIQACQAASSRSQKYYGLPYLAESG